VKLTEDDVAEFCRIYNEAYGEEMPTDQARMWAIRLGRLYRILLAPTPSEMADQLAISSGRATLHTPPATPVECRQSTPLPT
jgi:hypothetical protein